MKNGIVVVVTLIAAICTYVALRVHRISKKEDAESYTFRVDIIN